MLDIDPALKNAYHHSILLTSLQSLVVFFEAGLTVNRKSPQMQADLLLFSKGTIGAP